MLLFFSLIDLLLVKLVVELKFFLTAVLVAGAEVGLRQKVMGVGVIGFESDSCLELGDSLLIALLVVKKDPELKMCVLQLRVQ